MRALRKDFLPSLIQNEDSLTSVLTAIPVSVQVGKTSSPPPTAASYQLWGRCVRAKAKSAETSGVKGGPVPPRRSSPNYTISRHRERDARPAAWADKLQPPSPCSRGPAPRGLLPPQRLFGFTLKTGLNKKQGCFSRTSLFRKKKKIFNK